MQKPFIKANSKNAAKFLKNFIKKDAFPIKSIQVDEGIEFMKYFETTSPKINGNVNRMNRIITAEFLHEALEDSLVIY